LDKPHIFHIHFLDKNPHSYHRFPPPPPIMLTRTKISILRAVGGSRHPVSKSGQPRETSSFKHSSEEPTKKHLADNCNSLKV
jgi:hypothetical protein